MSVALVVFRFPDYRLKPIASDHPLYSLHFKIAKRPRLMQVSNGIRPLIVLSNDQLADSWHHDRFASRRDHFEVMANLFFLSTDMATLGRKFGRQMPAPATVSSAQAVIPVALLKYDGNWNPEPYAWQRSHGSGALAVGDVPT